MQGPRTHDAMKHADLTLPTVWSHFLNMGGVVEQLEVDAYLHGLMPLPVADRDCLAQAVNELVDDRVRAGGRFCCRAPYNALGGAHEWYGGRVSMADETPDVRPAVSGTAARPVPRPWLPRPVRRVRRREE